jgi:hypothetical protein
LKHFQGESQAQVSRTDSSRLIGLQDTALSPLLFLDSGPSRVCVFIFRAAPFGEKGKAAAHVVFLAARWLGKMPMLHSGRIAASYGIGTLLPADGGG